MATQKRFLANAARTNSKHRLRGCACKADLALRQGASTEGFEAVAQAHRAVQHQATHTVNQLLALARAEARGHNPCASAAIWPGWPLKWCAIKKPLALDKGLDLRLRRRREAGGAAVSDLWLPHAA